MAPSFDVLLDSMFVCLTATSQCKCAQRPAWGASDLFICHKREVRAEVPATKGPILRLNPETVPHAVRVRK